MNKNKSLLDYMWIWAIVYFSLGFFNIIFAWLGLFDFIVPLVLAISGKGKWFCNNMCGRGQLFNVLGRAIKGKNKVSRAAPNFLSSNVFRYSFLVFFLTMFANMLYHTYLVFSGAHGLRQVIKLLWTIKLPWNWIYINQNIPSWVYQFSYGFYSLMLTSTIIGLVTMLLFRNRTWCTFCPMGCMTQSICKIKAK